MIGEKLLIANYSPLQLLIANFPNIAHDGVNVHCSPAK